MNPLRLFVLAIGVALAGSAGAGEPPADRAERIDLAIELGVDFLLKKIAQNPGLEPNPKTPYGLVPFETYALIVSGVSIEHPTIRRGFRFMAEHDFKKKSTYTLACSIFAHDAAVAQLVEDELILANPRQQKSILANKRIGAKHRLRIAELTQVLLDGQNADGGWRYYPNQSPSDISCHQFAALALGIAAKHGIEVPVETWVNAARYCIAMQVKNGQVTDKRITLVEKRESDEGDGDGDGDDDSGKARPGRTRVPTTPRDPVVGTENIVVRARHFQYDAANFGPIVNAVWNRTCAGVSTLILADEHCGAAYPAAEREALHRAIRDGYGHLLENWKPWTSYYGIYSLEKLADIGRVARFGTIDWWHDTVELLLTAQKDDGGWPTTRMWGESHRRVTTAFALLTLKRATTLLTRNPAEDVILTGGRAGASAEADPDWVFLKGRDTCVHYPAVARIVRYRPTRRLLSFFDKVVASYDPEHRPRIVPSLIRIRRRVADRGAERALDRLLEEVSGRKFRTLGEFADWHVRWDRFIQAATKRDRKIIPALIATLEAEETSPVMKRAAVRATLALQARELVPVLLDLLEARTVEERSLAYRGLLGLFAEPVPPFDPDGSAKKRAESVERIRGWCEKRSAKP